MAKKKEKYTVEQLNELAYTKPSGLLLIAVEDMRALRKKKGVVFDMNDWVYTYENDKGKKVCAVCMAGATLNNRFGAKNFDDVCALNGKYGEPRFAEVVNSMRIGTLPDEVYYRDDGDEIAKTFCKRVMSTFKRGRERAELRTYERAAKYLESKGL